MDGEAHGRPVPEYLWQERNVVPFLKVDKGLEAEADGVSLMKPIPDLDAFLARAVKKAMFGTKMRSVIQQLRRTGISAIVDQQFALAERICDHGLVPIVEPEVSIKSADKQAAEALLRDAIAAKLDGLTAIDVFMLKLTIPDSRNLYSTLVDHPRIVRIVALSGGYTAPRLPTAIREIAAWSRVSRAPSRRTCANPWTKRRSTLRLDRPSTRFSRRP